MNLTKEQMQDYQKWYVRDPRGFSPERNKAVVDQTIREYEAKRAKQISDYNEQLGERIDAATSYLMHLEKKGDTPAERYFGKKELIRLRGQKIMQRVVGKQIILEEVN